MKKHWLILLLAVFLTACGSTPTYNKVEVQKVEYTKKRIPDDLLEYSIPEKPISVEEYMKLDPKERERWLADYNVSLLLTIQESNARIKKIRDINNK